jgi:ribokinase
MRWCPHTPEQLRVAVVGHVEWVEFARVDHVPAPGEIVHASETWQEPAGGGAVAAVELARLAGECLFLTALGDDELGRRAARELGELGVRVEAVWRPEPQRRAFVHLDAESERTITVIGGRMGPHGSDPLPWNELRDANAVYFTAGDAAAVQAARAARHLVATPRAKEALVAARVELDVLVCSAKDPRERYTAGELDPAPLFVVQTEGAAGGSLLGAGGSTSTWPAAAPPGPPVDAYGAGDSFAAGVTFGLAQALAPAEAVELGARCGAEALTRRGAHGTS